MVWVWGLMVPAEASSSHLEVILPKLTICSTRKELSVHGGGPSATLTMKCFSFPTFPVSSLRSSVRVLCTHKPPCPPPPQVLLHKGSSSFTVPEDCVWGTG